MSRSLTDLNLKKVTPVNNCEGFALKYSCKRKIKCPRCRERCGNSSHFPKFVQQLFPMTEWLKDRSTIIVNKPQRPLVTFPTIIADSEFTQLQFWTMYLSDLSACGEDIGKMSHIINVLFRRFWNQHTHFFSTQLPFGLGPSWHIGSLTVAKRWSLWQIWVLSD